MTISIPSSAYLTTNIPNWKRADSMGPVIVVASGRVIDVVFKKSFDLCEHKKKAHNSTYAPSTSNEKVNFHNKFDQSQKLEII